VVDLTEDRVVDFTLECVRVSVTGIVSSDCTGPLENAVVDLLDAFGEFFTVTTDVNGAYTFGDLLWSDVEDAAELSMSIPLGFEAVSPPVDGIALTLDQDHTVDFTLACLEATGEPRSMGYWKHQANVYLKGRGHAHEVEEDMRTNYALAIFDHFHENELNAIAVDGVTFMGDPAGPIDLETIGNTLTVKRGSMLDRAKQQYLALLLNVASGKLATYSVVSEDDLTASQALQQVAAYINDGDPGNDEAGKDIADQINNARLVAAGVIDSDFESIPYDESADVVLIPSEFALSQNHPNPMRDQTTISLAIPTACNYRLSIFDLGGRLVRQYGETAGLGVVTIVWDGKDQAGAPVAGGLYFYRAEAGDFSSSRKMLFLR
jgi:hypothetical protein